MRKQLHNSEETFGKRLQRIRQEKGRDVRDIAARAHIKVTYLQKIEQDYCPPPAAATIADLAKALGTDCDPLFALSNKLPPDLTAILVRRPLLMLLVRVGEYWPREQLVGLLTSEGVTPASILACDVERPGPVQEPDRRGSRSPITREMRTRVFELDHHECVYCSSQSVLEVDHIFLHSHGGIDEIENLVTCCSRCYKLKGNILTSKVTI